MPLALNKGATNHGLNRTANLQAVAPDQLQRVRLSHLSGLCHEAGGQAGRTGRLSLRERRGQDPARERGRAAHPPGDPRAATATRSQAGNETVLFRHEKTFFHAPGLFVRVRDTQPLGRGQRAGRGGRAYKVDYVGLDLAFDGMAVECSSGDAATFRRCVETVRGGQSWQPDPDGRQDAGLLEAGLERRTRRDAPALSRPTPTTGRRWPRWPNATRCRWPSAAQSLDELAELAKQISRRGVEDLVLAPAHRGLCRFARRC